MITFFIAKSIADPVIRTKVEQVEKPKLNDRTVTNKFWFQVHTIDECQTVY